MPVQIKYTQLLYAIRNRITGKTKIREHTSDLLQMEKGNGYKSIKRRIGIMLLSLIVAVTMMPVFAFADTEPETEDNSISTNTEATLNTDTDLPPVQDGDEDSDITKSTEDLDKAISEKNVAGNGFQDTNNSHKAESLPEEQFEFETVTNEGDLPDSEELLQNYLDSKVDSETGTTLNNHSTSESGRTPKARLRASHSTRRSSLNADEQAAYDLIKPYIEDFASGNLDKAKFSVNHNDNVYYPRVINALMIDMPYEFYWYDKVKGYLHGNVGDNKHLFILSVSKDYWNPKVTYSYWDGKLVYGINTEKTKSASNAVVTVTNIINQLSYKSDLQKLTAYKNCICALVEYDHEAEYVTKAYASHQSTAPFYGDPWQLISVFDCKSDTKVVCEGYSKAFQYLCDRTTFSRNIECNTVQGSLFSSSIPKGAGHMWNIIQMDDGFNYIADITNSDVWPLVVNNVIYDWDAYAEELSNNYDDNNYVFLSGWMGNDSTVATGYTYESGGSRIKYVYDELTRGGKGVKGMFNEYELTLSNTDYGDDPVPIKCSAKEPTCTESGNEPRWLKQGYYYKLKDKNCLNRVSYTATELSPLGHNWDAGTVTRAATEDTAGSIHFVCLRCGETKDDGIPMIPHTHRYTAADTLDNVVYRCACGDSYTRSKVVVDLPKVSIKRLSGAKAGFNVKWKKLSAKKRKKIKGYEIQYSTGRGFAEASSVLKTATKSKTSKKIRKLAKKKNYYIRIRTYKWIGGVKHVSKWSSVRKVKTK